MGLKKRAKVSAEFSMSSLTDIIFLLLIFFMLTSSLVSPDGLFLKLPGESNPTVNNDNPPDVSIDRSGTFRLNGKKVGGNSLKREISKLKRKTGGKKLDVTISPAKSCPPQHVVKVLDILNQLRVNAILTSST